MEKGEEVSSWRTGLYFVLVLLPPNRVPYRTGAQKVYSRSESVQHVQRMARSLGWLSHMVLGKTWGSNVSDMRVRTLC